MAGWAELWDEGRVPASNGRRTLSFDRHSFLLTLAVMAVTVVTCLFMMPEIIT